MKAIFVLALAVSFLAESRSLPVGKERRREDVVTRCLVEVLLSKTLTKPDLHPLDQECKDILKTGVPLAAPVEKKSDEEVLTGNEESKDHDPEVPRADVKDIEALLKSVDEKKDTLENDERSQESWDFNNQRDKRIWKPSHREKRIWKANLKYHHKKPQKRSGESAEDEGEEPRSDSKEHEEKRHRGDEEEGRERQEALRYLQEKRNEVESRVLGEGDERRSPWVYRGYYHPAWWKKSAEPKTGSQKIEELSKMLMRHQLTSQSELVNERKRSVPLTPEEEKLQNLAGMDMELQKISEKVHENRNE
ncbi:hypothetical protein DPEC_G00089690 [Dallia pectoralis]|uniref:Uncharacterized protein n=1 Tax=Dallia pectoralis TaxID=75939 RepID=A0ACC2H1C0_DALPE|nr:hypothetical protein DPEC_G00089690 [Dallia pectoralis]